MPRWVLPLSLSTVNHAKPVAGDHKASADKIQVKIDNFMGWQQFRSHPARDLERPATAFRGFTTGFYDYSRTRATVSEGVRESFVLQGLQGGVKGLYDRIAAFFGMDFTEDLRKIDVPTLTVHGEDDQIVPLPVFGQLTAKLCRPVDFRPRQVQEHRLSAYRFFTPPSALSRDGQKQLVREIT